MKPTYTDLLAPFTAYLVDTYYLGISLPTELRDTLEDMRIEKFNDVQNALAKVFNTRPLARYHAAASIYDHFFNIDATAKSTLTRCMNNLTVNRSSAIDRVDVVLPNIYLKNRKVNVDRDVLSHYLQFYNDVPKALMAHVVARFDYEFTINQVSFLCRDDGSTGIALPMFRLSEKYHTMARWILNSAILKSEIPYRELLAVLYNGFERARYLGVTVQRATLNRIVIDLVQPEKTDQARRIVHEFVRYRHVNSELRVMRPAHDILALQPLIRYLQHTLRSNGIDIKPITVENRVKEMAAFGNSSWSALATSIIGWVSRFVHGDAKDEITRTLTETFVTVNKVRGDSAQEHTWRIRELAADAMQLSCIELLCPIYYGSTEFDAYTAEACSLTLHQYLNATKKSALKLPCVNTSNAAALIPEIYGVPVLWVKAQQARLNDLPVGYMPSAKIDSVSYVNNGNRAAVKFDTLVLVYPDNTPVLFDRKGIWLGVKQLEDIVLTDAYKPHVEREAIYGENAPLSEHPSMLDESDVQGGYADSCEAPVVATEGICERCQAVTHVINNVCYDCSTNEDMGNPTFPTADDKTTQIVMQYEVQLMSEDIARTFRRAISEPAKPAYLCGQWIESQVDNIPLAPKLDMLTVNDIEEISRILYEYYGLRLRLRAISRDVKNAILKNNDVVYAFYRSLVVCYNFNNEMLRFDAKTRRLDIAQLKRILNAMGG